MTQNCVEILHDSNILVDEARTKSRVVFKNPNNRKFYRVKVDKCLIAEGEKCDWIVTECGVGSVLVELKGKNIKKAYDQLKETLKHPNCVSVLEEKRALLVICTRVPAADTSRQIAMDQLRKIGIPLTTASGSGRSYSIEELLSRK